MKYLIKLLIENEVFHNKLRNSLNIKEFKDLYTSKKITITSFVSINCYKKRTSSN